MKLVSLIVFRLADAFTAYTLLLSNAYTAVFIQQIGKPPFSNGYDNA